MDLGGHVVLALMLLTLLTFTQLGFPCSADMVFNVHHKFAGRGKSLVHLRAHDARRHGRFLSSIDLPLGGKGNPTETGLYFAKIGIGTPSKDYYVQVDTGSDILWVNCVGCTKCPTKSDIGLDLKLYDPKGSSTGGLISCDQDFCRSAYNGELSGCRPEILCPYKVAYGDGSSTSGYYVKDILTFDRISGNFQTTSINASVTFGCGAKQSGGLGASSSAALDGILGFGQANSSMISQLAASGKVKNVFAHCLDNVHGGGIFAIGQVVHPKVKTTPLVPNQAHYNVVMKGIEVGGDILQLPTDVFDTGNQEGTIIDSGTTLAYFPQEVYDPLVSKILAQQSGLKLHKVEDQFTCFDYTDNIDDGFPVVSLQFKDSVTMTVHPHDYMFQVRQDTWCIGWQSSGTQNKDGKRMTLLGDLVLSNRLFVYDLENQTIGWIEHNCSSSISVKDSISGEVHSVGAHHLLSSASRLSIGNLFMFWITIIALMHSFTH